MSRSVFITGNSSGLGLGLTRACLSRGDRVFGVSRRGCPEQHPRLKDIRCDLADEVGAMPALDALLDGYEQLDLVILNAGMLGPIQDLTETSLDTLREVMEVNVWANKRVIDWLIGSGIRVDQLVLISSGAAVNGHRGWGAYALSKATLNMLAQLYAAEWSDCHVLALAPGLIDTAMQDYLCGEVDVERFPSVEKLRKARDTDNMPDPDTAAQHLLEHLPTLAVDVDSGSFVDLRNLD